MNLTSAVLPIISRFRRARMTRFATRFDIGPSTRILDIGGTTLNWSFLDVQPHVTLLNLSAELTGAGHERFDVVSADGCALPFRDDAFDIAFCNSLIEHLPIEKQRHLAAEISRVAPSYFVQTPNFWFPVEPHFYAPFFHWLPLTLRRRSVRWITPWGLLTKPGAAQARAAVDEMRLLRASDLRNHFPDGQLATERFMGIPKSLITIRRPPAKHSRDQTSV